MSGEPESAATRDSDSLGARGVRRFLYPMRVIGTLACAVTGVLYVSRFGPDRTYYWFLLLLALLYPHAAYLVYRWRLSRKVELGTVLVDAFILGSTIYVTGFSLLPSLTLSTVALANGLALGGAPLMALSALFAALGVSLPMPLYGVNYQPRDVAEISLTCALFLLVYFNIFAYTAYVRTIQLRASHSDLKQQKITAEIEKKRSENLLRSLLPAEAARELDAKGSVRARRYPSVTILAVQLADFYQALGTRSPEEVLSDLNHCFKAFDAITGRHRLESLRTLGDTYLAAGGLPTPNDTHPLDAVGAALEIRDFMLQLSTARRAAGSPVLAARIGVHTGSALAGVVETAKFSYDVWGDAPDTALRLVCQVAPGEVGVSGSTRSLLENHFVCTAAGTVHSREGMEVSVHVVTAGAGAGAGVAGEGLSTEAPLQRTEV